MVGDTLLSFTDLSNGLLQATVGAFVADQYGNPVLEGTQVHFELTGANMDTADVVTWAITDAFGVAETTVTYPTLAAGVTITLQVSVGTVTETQDLILPDTP